MHDRSQVSLEQQNGGPGSPLPRGPLGSPGTPVLNSMRTNVRIVDMYDNDPESGHSPLRRTERLRSRIPPQMQLNHT